MVFRIANALRAAMFRKPERVATEQGVDSPRLVILLRRERHEMLHTVSTSPHFFTTLFHSRKINTTSTKNTTTGATAQYR